MKNFIYLTTNLLNGKQYIGDHSTNNLDDNYFGSGSLIKEELKKYKKENFKREILEFFPTKKEAFEAQEKYIVQFNTLFPNGYNISPKGGFRTKGYVTEETKNKISSKLSGKILSDETKQKMSSSKKGKKFSESHKEKLKISHKNKKPSKETKEKISLSLSGENHPFFGKKLSEDHKRKLKENHKGNSGKKFSDDHKLKISQSKTGDKNPMYGKTPWNKGLKLTDQNERS